MYRKSVEPKVTWTIASQPLEVANVSGNKTLLFGSTVFASSRDIAMPGYAKLTPRHGVGLLASFLVKDASRLHVALSEGVIKHATKSARVGFGIDGYLQWGIKRKGKLVLIGGIDSTTETSLDILIFDNGRFVEYVNKVLPGTGASHYGDTVAALLDDYAQSHPDYQVVQAAPLTPFGKQFPNVQYVGERIFKRVSFKPISQLTSKRAHRSILPFGLIAASVLCYAGVLGVGWANYRNAKVAFQHEISDPVVARNGGVDSTLIDLIQQRRFFMDEPRRQVALAAKSKELVDGVGRIQGLRILEMRLSAPIMTTGTNSAPSAQGAPAADLAPDVLLRVSVPLKGDAAMLQGKEVLQSISANTGISARLARQGWIDDGKRRVFTIEGFING